MTLFTATYNFNDLYCSCAYYSTKQRYISHICKSFLVDYKRYIFKARADKIRRGDHKANI